MSEGHASHGWLPAGPARAGKAGRLRYRGRSSACMAPPRIGSPANHTRPAAARQSKGEYPSVPDTVVDPRPPVPQKPLTASAVALLELYYKLSAFVMATEEKAPVEWAAERILGVRKAGLRDPARDRRTRRPRGLAPPEGARGHGERADRPGPRDPACALADAFFIALAGGESEARSCHDASPARREPTCWPRLATITTRPPPRCATTWSTPASCGGSARTVASGSRRIPPHLPAEWR